METATTPANLPKPDIRHTLYGPLYAFSCARCGAYVSNERPTPELSAADALRRRATLLPEGFVHERCKSQ